MVKKCALFLLGTLLAFGEPAFVDTLKKCDIHDGICQKHLIENILGDISKTGIEELNIPPIDPLKLKSIKIPILGLINITFEEGVVKGVKDCSVDSIVAGVEDKHAVLDLTCDVSIKGKYKVFGTSPLLVNLFGRNSIHGDGNAKVKLDKLKMKFEFFYDIVRKEDGEIYFKCNPDRNIYQFFVGTGKVGAEKIYLGNQDATGLVVTFLNENLKMVLDAFGAGFYGVATDTLKQLVQRFLDRTPAARFISTDLGAFVS